MPTLNIKDPEVYRLAAQLAERRGTSMTGAVRDALREALDAPRKRPPRAEQLRIIAEIQERVRRSIEVQGDDFLTDGDLYDENGLPR